MREGKKHVKLSRNPSVASPGSSCCCYYSPIARDSLHSTDDAPISWESRPQTSHHSRDLNPIIKQHEIIEHKLYHPNKRRKRMIKNELHTCVAMTIIFRVSSSLLPAIKQVKKSEFVSLEMSGTYLCETESRLFYGEKNRSNEKKNHSTATQHNIVKLLWMINQSCLTDWIFNERKIRRNKQQHQSIAGCWKNPLKSEKRDHRESSSASKTN